MVLRSRRENKGVSTSVDESGFEGTSETDGAGADAGGGSFEDALAGGGVVGSVVEDVTNVRTASDSTIAGFLPVAAAAPVPAAPPARVLMVAPFPPPAIAPVTAPCSAPPPIFVTLVFECGSPFSTRASA